jgi:hypothetical protein
MKEYFRGYYCRDDLHLQVLNKDSNRKILEVLREAYPEGLSVEEIASKAKLPIKTIYAQKAELYREYFVNHFDRGEHAPSTKRGRPSLKEAKVDEESRKRVSIVGEETYGIFDPFKGSKPVPLPPGHVIYSDGFTDVWHKLVGKDEQIDLDCVLSQFVERMLNRIAEYDDSDGNKTGEIWAPKRDSDFFCSQCGLNHEARDFIRATLMHAIDQFQSSKEYIELLKRNDLIDHEAYDLLVAKAVKA